MMESETSSRHELQELRSSNVEQGQGPPGATAQLPPTDEGKAAYLFLAGSFMIETLLWCKKDTPLTSQRNAI